jgi:hypothetical protein
MSHELHTIPAEGVRLDDVGSGFDVVQVEVAYKLGARDIQFIEAAADENALVVEHRAHRTVADQHAFLKGGEKIDHKVAV